MCGITHHEVIGGRDHILSLFGQVFYLEGFLTAEAARTHQPQVGMCASLMDTDEFE